MQYAGLAVAPEAREGRQSLFLYGVFAKGDMARHRTHRNLLEWTSPYVVLEGQRIVLLQGFLHRTRHHKREVRVGRSRWIVLGKCAEQQLREHPAIRSIVPLELAVLVTPGGEVLRYSRVSARSVREA